MHWQQPHTSCQQTPASIFADFLCQDKGQIKYSGISTFSLWKETRSSCGLKLGLLQYKYHLENNSLQENKCQVGWTDLLKYVEISLPPTLQVPSRLGPSAFAALPSCSPSTSPAYAVTFGERGCLLLAGQTRSCTFSSATKPRCPTLVRKHTLGMDEHFIWTCIKIYFFHLHQCILGSHSFLPWRKIYK